jgi:hypothetical protein
MTAVMARISRSGWLSALIDNHRVMSGHSTVAPDEQCVYAPQLQAVHLT